MVRDAVRFATWIMPNQQSPILFQFTEPKFSLRPVLFILCTARVQWTNIRKKMQNYPFHPAFLLNLMYTYKQNRTKLMCFLKTNKENPIVWFRSASCQPILSEQSSVFRLCYLSALLHACSDIQSHLYLKCRKSQWYQFQLHSHVSHSSGTSSPRDIQESTPPGFLGKILCSLWGNLT